MAHRIRHATGALADMLRDDAERGVDVFGVTNPPGPPLPQPDPPFRFPPFEAEPEPLKAVPLELVAEDTEAAPAKPKPKAKTPRLTPPAKCSPTSRRKADDTLLAIDGPVYLSPELLTVGANMDALEGDSDLAALVGIALTTAPAGHGLRPIRVWPGDLRDGADDMLARVVAHR